MDEELLVGGSTPSLESLHEVRLTALMHDMVDREGKLETAQLLGVNYKTLKAAVTSGSLTPRLADALEKVLLSRQVEASVKIEERVQGLEGRMEAVEECVRSISGEVRGVVEREQKRREANVVTGAEPGEVVVGEDAGPPAAAVSEPPGPGSRRPFTREIPSVVTMEPDPGDEEVFGDAWPLVAEWRDLRKRHPTRGRGLPWLAEEERLRLLEIALIGEHGLTIPPDTEPWDEFGLRTQVRWRTQTLRRVSGERLRAQLRRWTRRLLTLGLWWR